MRGFLAHHNIPFISRDIVNDPGALAEFEALGVSGLPTLALGDRRQAIFHVDQVGQFLGLLKQTSLADYHELMNGLNRILEAVEMAVLSAGDDLLDVPTPSRGRDLKELVFDIHDALVRLDESLSSGVFAAVTYDEFERSRHLDTSIKLAQLARTVRTDWYQRSSALPMDAQSRVVSTPRGSLTQHQLLSSQVGHAGHHLAQIYEFLREHHIQPEDELTADDMRAWGVEWSRGS